MTDRLPLDRVELADISAPSAMAHAIHRQLGRVPGAVPVDDIASALDITQIHRVRFDGCEGVLLTDRRRSYGRILVNAAGGPRRARFSIAHELGHFLLEHHVLHGTAAAFVCQPDDMILLEGQGQHQRQEREANRFAIELLAPAHLMRIYLESDPDLRQVLQARADLDVSLEALLRRYVETHDQRVAAVMTQGRVVRYTVRGRRFPWIKLRSGDRIPTLTAAHRVLSRESGVGDLEETHAAAWLNDADAELFEQTGLGRNGFGVTLLWAPSRDEDADEDDD